VFAGYDRRLPVCRGAVGGLDAADFDPDLIHYDKQGVVPHSRNVGVNRMPNVIAITEDIG
jgi:hypothetical protein